MRQTLVSDTYIDIECGIDNLGIDLIDEDGDCVVLGFDAFCQLCDMVDEWKQKEQNEKEQLKQQALSKITQEEREALGF